MAALLGLAVLSPVAVQAESEEARLRKLEDAVASLQKENAALKKTIDNVAPAATVMTSGSDVAAPPVNKIKLSDSVTEVRLYGEGRLRYFVNDAEATGLDARDHGDRERLRYRLRLGADIKLLDHWTLGFMVEENNSARSSNVTLGENPYFAKATVSRTDVLTGASQATVTTVNPETGVRTTGSGVATTRGSVVSNVNFGDTLFLGKAFLKYEPASWLTLVGGKLANPFVTTRMVWDPDITPEGFAEQFRYSFGPWGGVAALTGQDGKSVSAPATGGLQIDVFANLGQFIYEDVGFENNFNSGNGPFAQVPNRTDRWMLGWQIGARATLNKNAYFQVAPAFYHYTGGGNSSAGPFNGDSPLVVLDKNADPLLITFNQTGTNDLSVVDIPVELGFKLGTLPFTIFGDFTYNVDGDTRAEKAGHSNKDANIAYQIGASVGGNKKKGDWELRGWWQHSEAFSLDPNIIDDDIFDGRLNMEGFFLQASYNFTDAMSFIVQYCHGQRIDDSLGTPGFGALGTAPGFPIQNMNLLYVDLNLKF